MRGYYPNYGLKMSGRGRTGSRCRRWSGAPCGVTSIYLLVLALVAFLALPGFAGEAREEMVAGVRWVHNPSEPAEGRVALELTERWRLGDSESDAIIGAVAAVMRTDAGEIAILDNQLCEVRILSRDGDPIRTLGGRGEGPGEFLQGIGLTMLPGGNLGVVQSFPGKLITYFPDGTPAGEILPRLTAGAAPQSYLVAYRAQRAGERIALGCMDQQFGQDGMQRHHLLGLFAPDGTLAVPLWSDRDKVDLSQGYPMDEISVTRYTERILGRADGAVVAATDWFGYRIEIFDADGQPLLGITREYAPIDRRPHERKMIEELFAGFTRNVPNMRLTIEERHKAIEEMHWGPDGELWVLTGQGRYRAPAGSMGVYDVFDSHTGRFLRQVDLRAPGDPIRDATIPLVDQVIIIRGFYDAVLSMAGGGTAGEADVEEADLGDAAAEEVTILCYDL